MAGLTLPPHLSVRNGHVWIGECDAVQLAFTYGTPLYVTDENRIRQNYQGYKQALTGHYPISGSCTPQKRTGILPS